MHRGTRIKNTDIVVRLDRVQISSLSPDADRPPQINGFQMLWDSRVHRQTDVHTYARCRQLESKTSNAKIFWQYRPLQGWLKPWKITLVADDRLGISKKEVNSVLRYCKQVRFLTIEIAIDFNEKIGIDHRFIHRHAVFGKSRRQPGYGEIGQLRYGKRKAGKLVRCYHKEQLGVYRVELELHSRLLYDISTLKDFRLLPNLVLRKHLLLVDVNWGKLRSHLIRTSRSDSLQLLSGARRRRKSLRRLKRFLRKSKIANPHRFFSPLELNTLISRALCTWVNTFDKGCR